MLVLKGIVEGRAEVLAVRKEQIMSLNYWRDKCQQYKITVEIVLAYGKEVGIVIHESNINVLNDFIEGKTTQEPEDVKENIRQINSYCRSNNEGCKDCKIYDWCTGSRKDTIPENWKIDN